MSAAQIKKLYDAKKQQLDDLRITYKYEADEFFDHYLSIDMRNGKETRSLVITDEDIGKYKDLDFGKWVYLADFDAIASYDDGYIEACIDSPNRIMFGALRLLERINQDSDEKEKKVARTDREKPAVILEKRGVKIELSAPSEEMELLSSDVSEVSLKIRGLNFTKHDEAVSFLERISNSLFFDLEANSNVTFVLKRQRKRSKLNRSKRRVRININFPRFEYDREPMSLFWFSRTAVGMPLIQFLALYQVVEFYFPTYSTREAKRKLKSIVKDPIFKVDRDADIGKLLNAVKASKWGGIGSEREQLRATLEECLDADELREFIEENSGRKEFLSKSHVGLCSEKISTHEKVDPRHSVANAIYEIRCKIVHTKGDTGVEGDDRILPFGKEADKLDYYIELVDFVARKVLITANGPLDLEEA